MITQGRILGIALISLAVTVYALLMNKAPIDKDKRVPLVIFIYWFFFIVISAITFGMIMIIRG